MRDQPRQDVSNVQSRPPQPVALNHHRAAGGVDSSQRTVMTFLTTESFCPPSVILVAC